MFRPTLSTPPAENPVTLDEVKAHCVVDYDDDNDLIDSLTGAAIAHLDGFRGILGRAMVSQTWDMSLGAWSRSICLPVPDVSAVTITYSDVDGVSQTVAGANVGIHAITSGTLVYLSDDFDLPALESGNIAPVTVSFTCGFGAAADVPEALKTAIKALVHTWYNNRDTSADEALPLGVNALIAPYRWQRV